MVERCHRTIQDIVKKVVTEQIGWQLQNLFCFQLDAKSILQLDSVHFGCFMTKILYYLFNWLIKVNRR